ncbi:DUF6236 family protein [Nocardia goodfellowii]
MPTPPDWTSGSDVWAVWTRGSDLGEVRTLEQLGGALRREIELSRLSYRELADATAAAGPVRVSRSVISDMVRGHYLKADRLRAVLQACNVNEQRINLFLVEFHRLTDPEQLTDIHAGTPEQPPARRRAPVGHSPIALYGPWMHFQNDEWVKLSLLCWDRMVRVRPSDIDHDSEIVRVLRAESDFIIDIDPSFSAIRGAGYTFSYHVSEYLAERGRRWRERELLPRMIPDRPAARGLGFATDLVWIHIFLDHKMARPLADRLVAHGFAQFGADPQKDDFAWLGMHPRLGYVYLMLLCEEVASENRLVMATDDPFAYHAVKQTYGARHLLNDSYSMRPQPNAAFVELAIQAAIYPHNLADVPVAKLLAFRERYASELLSFHRHVGSLSGRLHECIMAENTQVAAAHLRNVYRTETAPQIEQLRRALQGVGIDSSTGTIRTKLDLGGHGLGMGGDNPGPPTDAQPLIDGIDVTATAYFNSDSNGRLRSATDGSSGNPVSYLLALGEFTRPPLLDPQ